MFEFGFMIIFYYGLLHALAPDHLVVIADFSIGKSKRQTMLITLLFALGHGITLFIFAKLLQTYNISDSLLGYGDTISSLVILGMGLFILFMVFTDRIQFRKHIHNEQEHIHIWYGKSHSHDNTESMGAFGISVLMGIGGVRGMLVTLGIIEAGSVDFSLVLAFSLGVMALFMGFGVIILYINKNILHSKQNVKRVFATAGSISVLVGTNMLFG